MRVLIVAPNISMRMGGEAVLPYHYIREFQRAGVDVAAIAHARVRDELRASEVWREGGFHFVEDSQAEKAIWAAGRRAPSGLADNLFNPAIATITMQRLAARARELCRQARFDVVHQPIPVSPRFPSFLTHIGAPVVIGPLNGAMNFPPGFARDYAQGSELAVRAGRTLSGFANAAAAGKREAARVLVANERTREALPEGVRGEQIVTLVENGVDLGLWSAGDGARANPPVFVFVGRLVRWKAVDLLVAAFAKLDLPARLLVIGDGPERAALDAQARGTPRASSIAFLGFRPQAEINRILQTATALVLPSLRECGGAVMLEAFASSTPVIATDWGGARDYVTEDSGILVSPTSRRDFVDGLATALSALARDSARVDRMGAAARRLAEQRYSWRAKAETMLGVYQSVVAEAGKEKRSG